MSNVPPTSTPGRLERVAHRGSPRERVENTLAGFLLAVDHGADAIELDVHATSDGIVVVHHDEVACGRVIAQSRWADVERLDLGGGANIPRLEEVFLALGDRTVVYVELKGRRIEDTVIDVVHQHGKRYALHSFDHDAIARVAKRWPAVPRGALLDRDTPRPRDALQRAVETLGPRDIWPHYSLVDETFMATASQLGLRVIPWTVNSAKSAKHLRTLGVAAICTDDVSMLANL
jgi:glycerophosphoryl diester phosphodiesterase